MKSMKLILIKSMKSVKLKELIKLMKSMKLKKVVLIIFY